MSQEPGLQYLQDLQNDPNINWRQIDEAHKNWNYKQQGLTPAAAVIIAIAVTVATAGAGSAAMSSLGYVGAGSTAAGGAAVGSTVTLASGATATVVSSSTMAAVSAGISTLAAQASISAINNQGDLGAVFEDIASDEGLKQLAFAVVTAGVGDKVSGATNGLITTETTGLTGKSLEYAQKAAEITSGAAVASGAQSAIYGDNLGETFVDRLKSGAVMAGVAEASGAIGEAHQFGEIGTPVQLGLHGLVGCAAGAAISGNCGAGAAAQVAGELSAELYHQTGSDIQTGLDIAQLSGATAALLVGGDGEDVSTGANLGYTAAKNNNYLLAGALAVGLYVAGDGDIVRGTEKLGIVTKATGQFVYRKMEDGVYAVYEMSPEAVSALGHGLSVPAESNIKTKQGQAPQIFRTLDDGSTRPVKFDGLEGDVLIDRKVSVVTTDKAKNQAIRQSEALKQNNLTGRWEVPNQQQANRALKMFEELNINNIDVRIVNEPNL